MKYHYIEAMEIFHLPFFIIQGKIGTLTHKLQKIEFV